MTGLLRDQLAQFARSGREDEPIIADLFDAVVTALKADARFAAVSQEDLEALLDDVRAAAEERLASEFVGTVSLDYADYVAEFYE